MAKASKKSQAAIVDAIEAADRKAVTKALDAGADVNADPDYESLLLRLGLKIWNSRTGIPKQDSPTTKKQRAIVELLLERGAKLDFMTAAMHGKKDFVEAALAKDPKLAKSKLALNGHTVTEMAGWCGASEVASLLRNAGKATKTVGAKPTDFRPWAMTLVEVMAGELARFAKKHPKATVTKIALDVNAKYGDIFLAVDTSSSKDWVPGSFTHPQLVELHENKKLEAIVDGAKSGQSGGLLTAGAAALLCLEGMGHLESLTLADDFDVLLLDHDEPEGTARKRMKAVAAQLEKK